MILQDFEAKIDSFGGFTPKKDTILPLKDYKGQSVQKSSFKGLFEIKDACTYTVTCQWFGNSRRPRNAAGDLRAGGPAEDHA